MRNDRATAGPQESRIYIELEVSAVPAVAPLHSLAAAQMAEFQGQVAEAVGHIEDIADVHRLLWGEGTGRIGLIVAVSDVRTAEGRFVQLLHEHLYPLGIQVEITSRTKQ